MDMLQWVVISAYIGGMVGTWFWFKAGCVEKGDCMGVNDYAMVITCMLLWPFILCLLVVAVILVGICFIPYFLCKKLFSVLGWIASIFVGLCDDDFETEPDEGKD